MKSTGKININRRSSLYSVQNLTTRARAIELTWEIQVYTDKRGWGCSITTFSKWGEKNCKIERNK